ISTSQANDCDIALSCDLQKMRVMAHQKLPQQLGIIRSDGAANAWPSCKLRSPLPHLRRIAEDAEIDQFVEHIEIAEDRCKDRINQAEIGAGKERSHPKRSLDTSELRDNCLPLAPEGRGITSG